MKNEGQVFIMLGKEKNDSITNSEKRGKGVYYVSKACLYRIGLQIFWGH